MKVRDLIESIEEFRSNLAEHQRLWGDSLESPVPEYPVRNVDRLREQSRSLEGELPRLRPYLERFETRWTMRHPATGAEWDCLEAAVDLDQIAQAKGPSLATTLERLAGVLARLRYRDPEEEIPEADGAEVPAEEWPRELAAGYLDHLHPFVGERCADLFAEGRYAAATEAGREAVFEYIRNRTGLTAEGPEVAEMAFSVRSPILSFGDISDDEVRNAQRGFTEVLRGFARLSPEPGAAEAEPDGERAARRAFEQLVTASLLCRRIDDASPRSEGAPQEPPSPPAGEEGEESVTMAS